MRDLALWTPVSDHASLTGMPIHPMFIVLKYVGWADASKQKITFDALYMADQ